jgi:hypothetical protein
MIAVVSAYGGVRFMCQLLFLRRTSPTALAIANNVCVPVLTAVLGILYFGHHASANVIAGILSTAFLTSLYAYVKARAPSAVRSKPPERIELVSATAA